MTRYVLRNGKLVEKTTPGLRQFAENANFPTPAVSRMQPFESPVTGKEITSWRERDRDMQAVGAVDPRDLPRAPFEKREQDNARSERADAPFEWRD